MEICIFKLLVNQIGALPTTTDRSGNLKLFPTRFRSTKLAFVRRLELEPRPAMKLGIPVVMNPKVDSSKPSGLSVGIRNISVLSSRFFTLCGKKCTL